MSMKQTSVAAADYSSTSDRTRRSPGAWDSEDHYEPLIVGFVADDYECRPTAGRTSMPSMVKYSLLVRSAIFGMVLPSDVYI